MSSTKSLTGKIYKSSLPNHIIQKLPIDEMSDNVDDDQIINPDIVFGIDYFGKIITSAPIQLNLKLNTVLAKKIQFWPKI